MDDDKSNAHLPARRGSSSRTRPKAGRKKNESAGMQTPISRRFGYGERARRGGFGMPICCERFPVRGRVESLIPGRRTQCKKRIDGPIDPRLASGRSVKSAVFPYQLFINSTHALSIFPVPFSVASIRSTNCRQPSYLEVLARPLCRIAIQKRELVRSEGKSHGLSGCFSGSSSIAGEIPQLLYPYGHRADFHPGVKLHDLVRQARASVGLPATVRWTGPFLDDGSGESFPRSNTCTWCSSPPARRNGVWSSFRTLLRAWRMVFIK